MKIKDNPIIMLMLFIPIFISLLFVFFEFDLTTKTRQLLFLIFFGIGGIGLIITSITNLLLKS